MTNFFEQIIYSSANEDPQSEIKGLNLNSDDKVLCITGSGARVLDLLIQANCHITAVDFNAQQNYLLELKMAAISRLDYKSFLDFLGVNPCSNRSELFTQIKEDLSDDAVLFWQKNNALIESGVLYQGVWERYMKYIAQLLWLRKKTATKLFSCTTLEEQRSIWNNEWKSRSWNAMLYLLGRRVIWKYILKEPGIEFVPKNFDVSAYLHQCFDHIANTQLFRTNPYLNLIFYGQYAAHCLPLHLQEKHYLILRERLKNVRIKTLSLQQALEEAPEQYTAFSISDFSSYSTEEHYIRTWKQIIDAAKDQAKFVERSFLVKYNLPIDLLKQIKVNNGLSQELSKHDHSFIYDVRCGTICK